MSGVATLADIAAIEAIPLEERILPPSTYALFRDAAQRYGDASALVFFLQASEYEKSVRFSYRQMLAKIHQTANALHALGIGPNDTVSYILPNVPQTYFALYGGEAAGISNPINPLLEPHVLADIMNAAQTKVLVTLAPFPRSDLWEKVAAIVDDVPTLHTILQVDLAGYLGGIKKLAVRLLRLRGPRPKVRARVLDFDKALAQQPADRLISGRNIAPDDIASYFHTGGTTGTPKLALHTHFNEVFDAWVVAETIGAEVGQTNYLGLPLFHNYGAIAIGLCAWSAGGNIIMGTPQGYRGDGVVLNFWKILAHYRCNIFSGVPTLFTALLNVPVGDADLSLLEAATCGAAPLPVEVANQFTKKTGINILEGYGLTEATSVCSVNPRRGEARIGSIGFRLPYQEMRTAVIENGRFVRFCETDEVGVVIVRGPNVFPGYKEAFHNRGIFVDSGDGGDHWLNTGDLGRLDADGYFWLTGREKELIIRGGHNIDPKQIEEPLHQHPAVALAAAVGRPDAHAGELPVVYVELKPNASASEEELLAFAQQSIGERAAQPRRVYLIDQMPLTAVGKIFKPALTRAQVRDVFEQALHEIEGVHTVTVTAEGDKRLGTVAHVRVWPTPGIDSASLEQRIRAQLGRYAVHYELKIE